MFTKTDNKQASFYLVTVDILQGICIFFFIIWHTMIWWDNLIDSNWPNIQYEAAVFMTVALLIPPFFFFLYGFNIGNSLLRNKEKRKQLKTRNKLIKKAIILFILAEISETLAGLISSPEKLINYIFTWELFHLFSISTLILLIVFEVAWYAEINLHWNYKKITVIIFSLFLAFVFAIFLIFHDNSNGIGIGGLYTNLNSNSIFKRIFFEDGQNPIIPWISFPIGGGLLALVLDLPHEQRNAVVKKGWGVLIVGTCFLMLGGLFLSKENFHSPPVLYPASASFIFITTGVLILVTMLMILLLDVSVSQTINKAFSPIILLSKISLTVFIVHNIAFVIPPESPLIRAILPSITAVMIAGILYCVFFILIAALWKEWHFKYSVEWMIRKLQNSHWGWGR
ncbi:MAG: hypothetical protein ACW98I_18935 [Candidatus Hodarchaeales archaeon]|jgi:hypothetical protein